MIPKTKLFSVPIRKSKCKFKRSCSLFSNASYTCTHLGGEYCGKYRTLTQAQQENSVFGTNEYLIEPLVTQ